MGRYTLDSASQSQGAVFVRWLNKLVPERKRANENTDHADRVKASFLANMSHELRTPMHAILSYAQLGRDASGEEQREYFDRITQRGQQLLHMLNDLLDLSQLEAGGMSLEIAENDMETLARDALLRAADSFQAKQVRVEIERAESTPDCRAAVDAVLMGKLFDNLLSNAARYSPQGGKVGISFTHTLLSEASGGRQQPALQLTITDEGIGIPESELELVFDKFVQSSKTRSNAGGTGMGLAICREIVALHGGNIWASNNRGPGATLHVLLPLSQTSSARETV